MYQYLIFMDESYSIIWVNHNLVIHSYIWFSTFSTIVNSAAMNMLRQVPFILFKVIFN